MNLDLINGGFPKQSRTIEFYESLIGDFTRLHYRKRETTDGEGAKSVINAKRHWRSRTMTHKMELWSHIDKQAVVKLQLTYLRTFQRAYLDLGKYLDDIQGPQNDRRTIDHKLRARSKTPWRTKPSLFAQHGDSSSMSGHRERPQQLQA